MGPENSDSSSKTTYIVLFPGLKSTIQIKITQKLCFIVSVEFRVLKLRFLALLGGPGGFRELREAGRNHFHLSWYLSVPGLTSYDQKN